MIRYVMIVISISADDCGMGVGDSEWIWSSNQYDVLIGKQCSGNGDGSRMMACMIRWYEYK